MRTVQCVIFDFADTISSSRYFQTQPQQITNWRQLFDEHIFADKSILTKWCRGILTYYDIADMIGIHVDMTRDEIVDEMKRGCEDLSFNEEVMNYAERQRYVGRKIALVTANMDIFTEIVAPAYDLNNKFDVIVNSADFETDDKLKLWPIAFNKLGANVDYECSLLIDDSEKWVRHFRDAKGQAYQYTNDAAFAEWQLKNQHV